MHARTHAGTQTRVPLRGPSARTRAAAIQGSGRSQRGPWVRGGKAARRTHSGPATARRRCQVSARCPRRGVLRANAADRQIRTSSRPEREPCGSDRSPSGGTRDSGDSNLRNSFPITRNAHEIRLLVNRSHLASRLLRAVSVVVCCLTLRRVDDNMHPSAHHRHTNDHPPTCFPCTPPGRVRLRCACMAEVFFGVGAPASRIASCAQWWDAGMNAWKCDICAGMRGDFSGLSAGAWRTGEDFPPTPVLP